MAITNSFIVRDPFSTHEATEAAQHFKHAMQNPEIPNRYLCLCSQIKLGGEPLCEGDIYSCPPDCQLYVNKLENQEGSRR